MRCHQQLKYNLFKIQQNLQNDGSCINLSWHKPKKMPLTYILVIDLGQSSVYALSALPIEALPKVCHRSSAARFI